MNFSWNNLDKPILALAPMAGYTDSAYRQLIKSLAPETVVFSEFVSSDAIKFKSKKTFQMLEFDPAEQPLVVQIFGKNPTHFAEAARVLESLGVAAVDINMGCPAKKVVSSDHGSALFKNPKLAREIMEATVQAVKIPVSVKMRVGTADDSECIDFAVMAEESGAQLVSIHGRTVKQMYTGLAAYDAIYKVKERLSIPVIGNGDVTSVAAWDERIGNLDGLMVGRGTVGNPWLMAELVAHIRGEEYKKPETLAERLPVIMRHAELMVQVKGEQRGMIEMRKFLAGYVKGEAGASKVRQNLVRVETLEEAHELLTGFIAELKKETL